MTYTYTSIVPTNLTLLPHRLSYWIEPNARRRGGQTHLEGEEDGGAGVGDSDEQRARQEARHERRRRVEVLLGVVPVVDRQLPLQHPPAVLRAGGRDGVARGELGRLHEEEAAVGERRLEGGRHLLCLVMVMVVMVND